jgi:uncharacterized membrane protein
MKKMNKSGLLSFTILLILVVMGIPVWNYFLGDGSLPSMNYLFFSLILFGVILLLIILNLDKIVKLSNPESKEENKTIEEIVSNPTAEDEVQEEIIPTAIAQIEIQEEIIPIALIEEKIEEDIVPTPTAEEKPKVEVKKAPVEKPAPTGDLKPFGSHSGNKRSGVWINEK